jgi:uncharacterized membrane protein
VFVNAAIVSGVATLYALSQTVQAWRFDDSIGDDVAHLVIIVALAITGWLTLNRAIRQLTGAGVLVLMLIWLGSILVHLPQGQAVVSMSWAVVGVVVLVAGAVRKMPEVGVAGLAVLGVTVAKLLTVDLQEVDALWRAGLFFVVGVGIMRLGFLLPRLTGFAADVQDSDQIEADH